MRLSLGNARKWTLSPSHLMRLTTTSCLLLAPRSFGFSKVQPTLGHADNTSAIQIVFNPVYDKRMKHMEVDCHTIQEAFDHQVITLPHITTTL